MARRQLFGEYAPTRTHPLKPRPPPGDAPSATTRWTRKTSVPLRRAAQSEQPAWSAHHHQHRRPRPPQPAEPSAARTLSRSSSTAASPRKGMSAPSPYSHVRSRINSGLQRESAPASLTASGTAHSPRAKRSGTAAASTTTHLPDVHRSPGTARVTRTLHHSRVGPHPTTTPNHRPSLPPRGPGPADDRSDVSHGTGSASYKRATTLPRTRPHRHAASAALGPADSLPPPLRPRRSPHRLPGSQSSHQPQQPAPGQGLVTTEAAARSPDRWGTTAITTSNSINISAGPVETPASPAPDLARHREAAARRARLAGGGLCGLRNLGNTCFMNSVLQCLSATEPLRDFFLDRTFWGQVNANADTKGELALAFSNVMAGLWSRTEAVAPRDFKGEVARCAPRFSGFEQHDAHEFLRFLLDALHEDLDVKKGKPARLDSAVRRRGDAESARQIVNARSFSFVGDLFMGQLRSSLRCSACGQESVTFEPFWDLSLSLPDLPAAAASAWGPPIVSLDRLLASYVEPEALDGDNKVHCNGCNRKTDSTKFLQLEHLPEILVVHLLRFSQGYTACFRKNTTTVSFPLQGLSLDEQLSKTCRDRGVTYDLYAVSNHTGSMTSGHYTATSRHPETGAWHTFNDSLVGGVASTHKVGGPQAYLLFYHRRSRPHRPHMTC